MLGNAVTVVTPPLRADPTALLLLLVLASYASSSSIGSGLIVTGSGRGLSAAARFREPEGKHVTFKQHVTSTQTRDIETTRDHPT